MGTEEKKGITVKVDADLHAEVRRYLEQNGMTMGEFVAIALHNELHPKITEKEDTQMGNMRTLAFQVPEDLFQKNKLRQTTEAKTVIFDETPPIFSIP